MLPLETLIYPYLSQLNSRYPKKIIINRKNLFCPTNPSYSPFRYYSYTAHTADFAGQYCVIHFDMNRIGNAFLYALLKSPSFEINQRAMYHVHALLRREAVSFGSKEALCCGKSELSGSKCSPRWRSSDLQALKNYFQERRYSQACLKRTPSFPKTIIKKS